MAMAFRLKYLRPLKVFPLHSEADQPHLVLRLAFGVERGAVPGFPGTNHASPPPALQHVTLLTVGDLGFTVHVSVLRVV